MSGANSTLNAKKGVISTGLAAKWCNLSQQSIIRSFDLGRLQGFRIPGSRFRRTTPIQLAKFCTDYNIPIHPELAALLPPEHPHALKDKETGPVPSPQAADQAGNAASQGGTNAQNAQG